MTAALLAIFLGGLGIHKFYLGRKARGCLYLACYWTGIPALLGIIEGIRYLTLDGTTFWQRYSSSGRRAAGLTDGPSHVSRNALIIWTIPALLLILMLNQTGDKSALTCMWNMAQDGCRGAGGSIVLAQLGIVAVTIVWFMGVAALVGLAWLAGRLERRLCPACGNYAKGRRRYCPRCGTAVVMGPPLGWGQPPDG